MIYTILSAAYANQEHTSAIILTEESGSVAISEIDNPEMWQSMLELQVEDFEAPLVTLQPLSPWQIRQGLNIVGKRDEVEALVASGDIELRDAWQYANEFRRDNPIIIASAPLIDLPENQLDDLFAWFATLQPV